MPPKVKIVDVAEENQAKESQKNAPKAINVPDGFFEITDLPSKFKLYPEGTRIFARALKILEVKQLASMSESNYNQVTSSVLKKTIIGIDVEDLVSADKLYIIFWQRANTYQGDGFSVPFKCELCSTESKYDFDISNLEIIDVKDEYDPNKELVLSVSGDKIKIGQVKVRDERLVENFAKANSGDWDPELLLLSSIILSVNGKDMSLRDKYNYLVELNVKDNLQIEKYYRNYEISLNPMLKVTCKNCGGLAETPISFRPDFFVPEYSA